MKLKILKVKIVSEVFSIRFSTLKTKKKKIHMKKKMFLLEEVV